VYPAPGGNALHAYDINAETTIEISLPEPILTSDLLHGRSPDGRTLAIRAGSVLNAEELAVYRVDLSSFEVTQITPLLSLPLQRQVVNQEGTRAVIALEVVTRPDGLAWSPDGRFLAFNGALNNDNSDLYVLDTLNNRFDRANRFLSQNASPLWAPKGNWLISQELEIDRPGENDWRTAFVTGLLMPSFINIDTVYQPPPASVEEVFLGWLNENIFISYSMTKDGPRFLRTIGTDNLKENMVIEGAFQQAAFDPETSTIAFTISYESAIPIGLSGGIYRVLPDNTGYLLQQEGSWERLAWDPVGMFIAAGSQGVTLFSPSGESLLLTGQGNARLSPNGNWMIAWGDGKNSTTGARLYQSNSNSPLQTLVTGPVETVLWQPDSQGFIIQSEGALYQFVFPGLRTKTIAEEMPQESPIEMIWVE
jgi:dipeptidyl aminopeptidase/acylaminoacyl peptidase